MNPWGAFLQNLGQELRRMDTCHLFFRTYCVDPKGKRSGRNISNRQRIQLDGLSLIKFLPTLSTERLRLGGDRRRSPRESEEVKQGWGSGVGARGAPADSCGHEFSGRTWASAALMSSAQGPVMPTPLEGPCLPSGTSGQEMVLAVGVPLCPGKSLPGQTQQEGPYCPLRQTTFLRLSLCTRHGVRHLPCFSFVTTNLWGVS